MDKISIRIKGIATQLKDDGTTIYLLASEIETFKIFRKYQIIWERIFEKPIKSNKVILHFDQDGRLRKAEIPDVVEM